MKVMHQGLHISAVTAQKIIDYCLMQRKQKHISIKGWSFAQTPGDEHCFLPF